MPHTPLAQMLRRAARTAAESSLGEVETKSDFAKTSRREFIGTLSTAAFASLATMAPSALARKPQSSLKVAVIGAGLAGLTCAYRLKQAGIIATIYEANTRLGGRCWTRRGDFAEGQIVEHGGELIDQGHTRTRQLAQELRLPLDNLLTAELNGTEPWYYFDGARYSYEEAVDDLKAIWQTLHRDVVEASYPTLYNRVSPRAAQLDQMSIIEWINESIPDGMLSPLGQLLDTAYNIEYGAECDRQSALNLVYLLGYNSPGQFSVFGQSDEKFHVRGGNDRIPASLGALLASQLVVGTRLVAVRRNPAGSFRLTFQDGARVFEIAADKVVFALPFSIMRESVDLTEAGFSDLKMTAIRDLAMGTSSKLNVQFNRRHWNNIGSNGDTYSDRGYQNTWEVTRSQPGTAGILVDYTGGNIGNSFDQGSPTSRAAQFLAQVEPVIPGLTAHWNGRATIDHWPSNPFSRGSYSYWQVGQYTRFAGIEGVQEGNAHFCGEHTSIDAQGYLEGAVESGERAAAEVASELR